MDRLALVAAAVCTVACGAPARPISGSGQPLERGATPAHPATGLRTARALSRGTLSYAVAYAGDRVVSIELATAFELVVRDARGTARGRVDLGEATYDVVDLAVHGDSAWVASVDGRVRAIDIRALAVTTTWHLGAPATAVAVSADGAYVATGDGTGVVCLRRAGDGALLQCVAAHAGAVSALDFSADKLASASWSGDVTVWSVPSLAVVARRQRRGSANDVAFAPDGKRLAVAWSLAPPQRTPAVARREARRGFGPVDPYATVEIVDVAGDRSGDVTQTCTGHAAAVTSVAWTRDGARLASASWDRTLRLWNAQSCRMVARLGGWAHLLRDVDADASGRRLAVAAWGVVLDARATTIVDLLY